jgi:hypothetical protein
MQAKITLGVATIALGIVLSASAFAQTLTYSNT